MTDSSSSDNETPPRMRLLRAVDYQGWLDDRAGSPHCPLARTCMEALQDKIERGFGTHHDLTVLTLQTHVPECDTCKADGTLLHIVACNE